jgi:hypothetical protein
MSNYSFKKEFENKDYGISFVLYAFLHIGNWLRISFIFYKTQSYNILIEKIFNITNSIINVNINFENAHSINSTNSCTHKYFHPFLINFKFVDFNRNVVQYQIYISSHVEMIMLKGFWNSLRDISWKKYIETICSMWLLGLLTAQTIK